MVRQKGGMMSNYLDSRAPDKRCAHCQCLPAMHRPWPKCPDPSMQARAVEEAAYALNNRLDRDGLSQEAQAEYDRLLQERYCAASGGQAPLRPASGAAAPQRPPMPSRAQPEDLALTYARQTRNAAVFIAWVVGIVMVLSLIGVIVTANELSHLTNAINNGGSSNCIPGVTC